MAPLYTGRLLIIFAATGIIGLASVFMSSLFDAQTDMRIVPQTGNAVVGETFTIMVEVSADTPVNVFQGELEFNPQVLKIKQIDYNTSIADLWAERPWYSNGEGTMNFAGGTTRPGGFIGTGNLITITFETLAVGEAPIAMREVRILAHDGLGTDTAVAEPIDAIFTVSPEKLAAETVVEKSALGSKVYVIPEPLSTDLNGDGKHTIGDMSIFMQHLATGNLRSDFNGDGRVSMADASILLSRD